MHLVNGDRFIEPLAEGSRGHPFLVAPGEFHHVPDDGSRSRTQFGGESVGVGFLSQVPVIAAADLELVHFPLAEIGDEKLPDAGRSAISHWVTSTVPVIEVADHADSL